MKTGYPKQVTQIREFNRFYTDLIGLLNAHLLNSDYSLAEARILYEIFSGGRVSASAIIHKLSIDKGYLSRILKKFEKLGLINKTIAKSDARAFDVTLTEAGLNLFKKLDAASDEQINTILSGIAIGQIDELTKHMNAIMLILKKNGV